MVDGLVGQDALPPRRSFRRFPPPARKSPPAKPGPRLDALDGLRTVAVFLVIFFHISSPGFAAGFIGVDVFFVLSGYLITAGLVKELYENGGLDLPGFWARRFRRLLPAAALTMATVLIVSATSGILYRQITLGTDVWWTALYLANWHFMGAGSYFSSDGQAPELLHTWSLAVEEQFYLGWPLLLTALAWAARRRLARRQRSGYLPEVTAAAQGRRTATYATFATLALIVISAALLATWYRLGLPNPAQAAADASVDRAYMGTDAKIFEPLLGALIALLLARAPFQALVDRLASALVWTSSVFAALLYLFMAGDQGPSAFYFQGGSLLITTAIALLIAGLARGGGGSLRSLLSWAPVAYLGRISYGLYLWHWPWVLWLECHEYFRPKYATLAIALTIACAAASYHLVELPIRSGALSRLFTPRRTFASSLAVIAALMVGASFAGGTPLTPAIRSILPTRPAGSTFMFVGDSVPSRLLPALAEAGAQQGLSAYSAARGGCSPLGVHQVLAPGDTSGEQCLQIPQIQTAGLREHPDFVVWWSRYEVADILDPATGRLLSPTDPASADAFWAAQEAAFRRALERLTSSHTKVIFIATEVPSAAMTSRCTPDQCHPFLRRLVERDDLRVKWNEWVSEFAAQNPDRLEVVEITDLACPGGTGPQTGHATGPADFGAALCSGTNAAGRQLRPDGSHYEVKEFGAELSGQLWRRIREAAR